MSAILILAATGAYGLLHSVLASVTVKNTLGKLLGRWYRLFFNAVAFIALLPVLALASSLPDQPLYAVPSPWRWGLVAVQGAAAVLAALAFIQTDIWHFLGVRQILQNVPPDHTPFKEVGFYRRVRHPAYFFSLILLWASPVMTLNQLTLYGAFSLYFGVGAIFEERKLAREFGVAYRDYQRRVPMFFPWEVSLWK